MELFAKVRVMTQAEEHRTPWIPPSEPWIPTPDSFAMRLAMVCQYTHLSGKRLALLCGFPASTFNNWVGTGATPADTGYVARRVAEVTGVNRDWLLYGQSEDIDRYMHNSCNQLQFGQAEGYADWGDVCTPTKNSSTSTRADNATEDSHPTRSAATAASSERSSEPSMIAA